ncbi:hypothetical protein HOI26_05305 [Candidatus Woesearchaeota archaeon]|jgi:hypothetical protein|nr:hypothetical protein [Candidatus Woesearchaeota archaeon]MBT5740484.1 hypothetical protein [Candidatus Woesearchaeota archaeon]
MDTPEHQIFKVLQHWQPERRVWQKEELLSTNDQLFPLFSFLYDKTKKLYEQVPRRKNGENPFIHPINVVINLKKAGITNQITLCAGLVHDYIEELVDIHQLEQNITTDELGKTKLDIYETQLQKAFLKEMNDFCVEKQLQVSAAEEIVAITKLLTRQKRHFYYKSISGIFTFPDKDIQKKALQVKLADRIHNVLCIESFDEPGRMHTCYKTLFILNNVKQWLIEMLGKENLDLASCLPEERLFNKCCKATYDAFLTLLQLCRKQGIHDVTSMLHLAFKKFVFEIQGLWEITEIDTNQQHPFRLFQGIIKKYDARLRHDWDVLDEMKKSEFDYCKKFFIDKNFNDKQLKAVIDYKDAYALKEAVAGLLYDPDYVLHGFLYNSLDADGKI